MDYMDNYDMRLLNRQAGYHWFDPSTMRFFDSRCSGDGYMDDSRSFAFFVSSERFDDDARRLYSVRVMHLTTGEHPTTRRGSVDTVGAFQSYATSGGAHKRARALAADPSDYAAGLAIDDAREAAQA